jgi:hypothetical protein
VVSAAEVALATREVSLGRVHPGAFPKSLAVSPNSKRVAYAARRGGKGFVVVDGVEGKEYDGFMKGSRLIFDSPSQFHTLALSGNEFLRVEVEIVMPAAEPSGAGRPHLSLVRERIGVRAVRQQVGVESRLQQRGDLDLGNWLRSNASHLNV